MRYTKTCFVFQLNKGERSARNSAFRGTREGSWQRWLFATLTGLQIELDEGKLALFGSPVVLRAPEEDVEVGNAERRRSEAGGDDKGGRSNRSKQREEHSGRKRSVVEKEL